MFFVLPFLLYICNIKINGDMDKNTMLNEIERIDNALKELRDERVKVLKEYVEHLNSKYQDLKGKYVNYVGLLKYGGAHKEEGFFEEFALLGGKIQPILYKKKKDGTPSKNTVSFYCWYDDFDLILAE